MLFLGGLILIVLGLLSIFGKDLMWELTQWNNQMRGLASERTEWWDTSTTIGGIFAVVLGAVAMFAAVKG